MHQDLGRADEEGVILRDGEAVHRHTANVVPQSHHDGLRPVRRAQPVAHAQLPRVQPARRQEQVARIDPEGVVGRHRDRAAVAQINGEQR